MVDFNEKYGAWALVTGATAGIGWEFAQQLAERGMNIILVARRPELLEQRAKQLRKDFNIDTLTVSLDLSDAHFIEPLRSATEQLDIGIVVNNAGTGVMGEFLENDLDDELDVLHLNMRAPLVISHSFGREMAARGRGAIVFVSSMVGLMGVPRFAQYAATKAYDLLLGEALHKELEPHGVDVLTLLPGFTHSDYVAQMDLSRVPMPVAATDKVVADALRKLGRRSLAIQGLMNQMLYATAPILPRRFNTWMMGTIMARIGWKGEGSNSG